MTYVCRRCTATRLHACLAADLGTYLGIIAGSNSLPGVT